MAAADEFRLLIWPKGKPGPNPTDFANGAIHGELSDALEQGGSADREKFDPWIEVDGAYLGPDHVRALHKWMNRQSERARGR